MPIDGKGEPPPPSSSFSEAPTGFRGFLQRCAYNVFGVFGTIYGARMENANLSLESGAENSKRIARVALGLLVALHCPSSTPYQISEQFRRRHS